MLYRLCLSYEVKPYLDKSWFKECIPINDPTLLEKFAPGTYFVPLSLYSTYMERKVEREDTFPPSIEPIIIIKLRLHSGIDIRSSSDIESYLSDYGKHELINFAVDSRIIRYEVEELLGRKVTVGEKVLTL